MDNTFLYPHEIIASQDTAVIDCPTEHNVHFRNVHFRRDFGPWAIGQFVKHLFIDYHQCIMRELTNGGTCIRNQQLEVSADERMIRPEPVKQAKQSTVKEDASRLTADPADLPCVLLIQEVKRTTLDAKDTLVVTFPQTTTDSDLELYAKDIHRVFKCKVLAKKPDMKIEVIVPATGNAFRYKAEAPSHTIDKENNVHLADTDVITTAEETLLGIRHDFDFREIATSLRKVYEEANQTTMDLLNGYAMIKLKQAADPQLMPQEDPKNGYYSSLKKRFSDGTEWLDEGVLKPFTLLEGISQRGPRDAVICGRYLNEFDGKATYVYVVRTFIWGNITCLTAAELAELFRVTSRTWDVEILPAWSVERINQKPSPMEYKW